MAISVCPFQSKGTPSKKRCRNVTNVTFIFLFFGSDRSPRCKDVVHACVRDVMQKNSENEFHQHSKEFRFRGVLGGSRVSSRESS